MVPNLSQRKLSRDELVNALVNAGGQIVNGSTVRCPFHDDRNPSGSIHRSADGNWRFTCHTASCGFSGDVWDVEARHRGVATEHYLKSLSGPPSPPRNVKPFSFASRYALDRYIVSTVGEFEAAPFEYRHPDTGAVEMLVYRIEKSKQTGKKSFRQAHWNGKGWVPQAPPKPWPLYMREKIRGNDVIVVCEGEKAVHALNVFGFCATTNPGGAGKADHVDWTPLAGKQVILWPDNDAAGRKHMAEVNRILEQLDPPCRISMVDPVEIGLGDKDDAFDFVAALAVDDPENPEFCDIVDSIERVLKNSGSAGPSRELRTIIGETISGRRKAVAWPWRNFANETQALLPGTLTVLCGNPGGGKSFWLLEALVTMHQEGNAVAVFELEEDRGYHLHRVLAQVAENGNVTKADWVAANPNETMELFERHRPLLDSFGKCIWAAPDSDVSLQDLVAWAEQRAREGARVIAIDPVTAAVNNQKNPWDEDLKFINATKRIAGSYATSIILVTHPKKDKDVRSSPTLADLSGGAAYSRLTQTVVWMESKRTMQKVKVVSGFGPMEVWASHILHINKARNGTGNKNKIAYAFENMRFVERGIVHQGDQP